MQAQLIAVGLSFGCCNISILNHQLFYKKFRRTIKLRCWKNISSSESYNFVIQKGMRNGKVITKF
ncbi:MAG: hypothetical protein LBB53_04165, partial [Prevotellaceae bacterium]|nr:hypothetical protein [Prevotellaceae bacterium]